MEAIAAQIWPKTTGTGEQRSSKYMSVALFAVLVLFIFTLDIVHLIFAVVGFASYALLLSAKVRVKSVVQSARLEAAASAKIPSAKQQAPWSKHHAEARRTKDKEQSLSPPSQPGMPCYRQPSCQPVAPKRFTADCWDTQVCELLDLITPSPETDKVVQKLTRHVQQKLSQVIPDVEVIGFASGDISRGSAFGVAVPELDVVVNVSPKAWNAKFQASPTSTAPADERRLQKAAIRTFTDVLVSNGGMKFRRSAFRGQDPKVTLLAPASLGFHGEAIPLDFTVNSSVPLHNAALLMECGHLEPRSKELILLVKRWAKDRGICHAAKGHLSPYAWTLLSIYFLQVAGEDGSPLLPPLHKFKTSSSLMKVAGAHGEPEPVVVAVKAAVEGRKPAGALFKDFFAFYHDFQWANEVVCVRQGVRAQPQASLPVHTVVAEDGTSMPGPNIEDPFDTVRNLGDCITCFTWARLQEELSRAKRLSTCNGSLSELLELWVPPEKEADASMN